MMSPEERQLLAGLFDRTRAASGNARDAEAEAFIADAVRQQPSAPYLLAQAVIVQEQALRAANDRLQQLEAQVREMEGQSSQGSGSFLSGLGKSIFGGSEPQRPEPARTSVPPAGGSPWGNQRQGSYQPQQQPGGWQQGAPQQQGGPWQQAPQQGGGFLKGALGAAAGVAGGVLLANSISGLFNQHNNPLGIASGMGGLGGGMGSGLGGAAGSGETVVNNYYGSDASPNDPGYDQADFDDSPDPGSDMDSGWDSGSDTTDV